MDVAFFDSLNSMIMALDSGTISSMVLPSACADYLMAQNPDTYQAMEGPATGTFTVSLSMGVLNDKAELLTTLDQAIADIKADGTMDTLKADYIDAVIAGSEPAAVEMPVIEGADTIRVVVTGDLPPYDYASTDGTAAGFNVALLAEISTRANLNVELVMADAGSRASMLSSGRADVVFWMRSTAISLDGEVTDELNEAPADMLLSTAYIEDSFVFVSLAQ